MTAVSPDARLPGLHAEAGDPHTRLARALADLEGADWGLLLGGEAALARQLAAQLGPGTLRVDARLAVSRELFAAAGLAVATIDADWRGARAVWLLEPDERALKRATRAGVPIIVDGTLAPGGGWLNREAALVVYRDGATLTGFGDVTLSALFGPGNAPERAAPAPSDLSLAMALRDLATLPLRLARAARTAAALAERFGGAAQPVGPTALLLAPDSAADTSQPLGGVLAAARNVGAGTLITPGVQSVEALRALLSGEPSEARSSEEASVAPKSAETAPQTERQTQPAPVQQSQPQPHQSSAAPSPTTNEALSYVPEIVFSDSVPQQGRGEIAETGRPSVAEPQDDQVSADNESLPENEPRRESQERSSSRPPESRNQDRRRPRPERLPNAAPVETAPDLGGSEPPAPPELVLPPDLPPSAASDPAENLDDTQRATYARLRDWRNAEAKRQEISRFIIASNATLAEIARTAPSSDTELRQVRGMGPERVRKYGEAILGTVQAD
ncbi:HRDC domain-containing protein [Deinococcus sp.]|uniref:HRDC domain-containing protein n=1 Tax=Deinococcus sp. TaxID=47478 RepID=UPI003B591464